MTRRIHVLTAGFTTPNGCAFLMPLILHRKALLDAGISVRFFYAPSEELTDCDALLLDSKYYSPRWAKQSDGVLAELSVLREKVKSLIFMEILDSASFDHARPLEHVTLYCKAQLLKDRTRYLKPLYGYRTFSDYYYKQGIEDEDPVWSEPVADKALLDKLMVHWNSGLADYSWLGPYRMTAYGRVRARHLLRFPSTFAEPSIDRPREMSCRIGTNYIRKSVAWQRLKMAEILRAKLDTVKLSRRRYIEELRTSKVVISPFGLGEITLRDFEIFMAGALLIKPDMSHMETWPDLYVDGETMVAHSWDLSDLEDRIDLVLSDYAGHLHIAREGQGRYREHLCGPRAGALFAAHLSAILDRAESLV